MAPLQIRYLPTDGTSEYRRRIVVQLAATSVQTAKPIGTSKSDRPRAMPLEEMEGGQPLIYEASTRTPTLQSGWVIYVAGSKGGRAQGLVKKLDAANRGDDQTVEMASRWIERLQDSTEELSASPVSNLWLELAAPSTAHMLC